MARKWVMLIIALSALLIAGGAIFYLSMEAVPFAVGVVAMMIMNIISVLWLKRTVENAVDMEAVAAVNYVRFHRLMRFLAMGAVLFISASAPDHIISIMGALFGIAPHFVAMRLLNFI